MSEYLKDYENFFSSLNGIFDDLFDIREISKGDHLFKQGEVCKHLFFIKEGLARLYYFADKGKEITAWFSPEGTIITAIDSFSRNDPTKYNCEALENLVVYAISYPDLLTLLNNEKGVHFTINILHEMAKNAAEHIDTIKTQSAENRYKALIKKIPSVLQRVPLGQLASYLGMTQETLSRIRGRI